MNRFIISILSILFPLQLLGQMFPLSDHYILNGLVINPAFAGRNDALSATISYRNQWVGFEDAPTSYMLSVHTPVYNDKVGLGLMVQKNSIGIFQETSFIGNYAYRMELQDGIFAMGLGFGVTVYDVSWNSLAATDPDDIQLMNNTPSATLPTFSLGTYYYTKKYFVGISMPMFLSHELDKNPGDRMGRNFSECTYFLTGGYEADMGAQVKLLPSMLIKYHPGNAIQIDYNAQINLKDQFWMGIGYRNKNMLVGMLQCQLNYQLRMAYSYDFDFGRIGKYRNGSHEIALNYVFSYAIKVKGPRHF